MRRTVSGPALGTLGWLAVASMTVGCRAEPPLAWDAAMTLADRDAANPTIAVDHATGAAYVVWAAASSDSTEELMFAAAPEGGAFGAAKRINTIPGELNATKEYPPQVVAAGKDTIYVGWVAGGSVPGHEERVRGIRIARSIDGGATFDSARAVGADLGPGPPTFAYFDIAAGPKGAVFASWLDLGAYAVRAAEYTRAGKKVDPWSDSTQRWAEQADLRFARSVDGGMNFVTSAVVDSIACICCRTAVAAGSDGAAHLMWRHVFEGYQRDFVVARAPSGEPPKAPVRVHEDRWELMGCPDIGPDLATDDQGGVHAAWYTGAPNFQGLHYALSTNRGATFGPPVGILTGPSIPTSEVKLAVTGTTPWLVWEDQRAAPSKNPGPLWGDPSAKIRLRLGWITARGALGQLPEPVGFGRSPAIAAGAGRLGIAWEDRGRIVVRLGRLKPRAPNQRIP